MTDLPKLNAVPRGIALLLVVGFAGMLVTALTATYKNSHVVVSGPVATSGAMPSSMDGRAAEAVGRLMQKVGQEPKNLEAHIRLVEALIAIENWQAAETFVNRAIVLDAGNPHSYHLLSIVADKLGHKEEAESALKKVEALKAARVPDKASGSAGSQAAKNTPSSVSSEMARKIAEAEKSTLANPKDAARWTSLGNLYFDAHQPRQAINAYERSLALAPKNPDVLTDMGVMYREAGEYGKAVDSFRKASAIDAKHQNALFNEGVVLLYDMQRKDDAIAVWQKLLRINPGARAPNGQTVSEILKGVR